MSEIEVAQVDRDVADAWKRDWENCRGSHTALVEAFARHRLQSEAPLRAEIARLREDALKMGESGPVAYCESCGAWLLEDDDFVSDDDGVSGCWATMTDLPTKRERACYACRVGKPDASQALGDSHVEG